MIQKLPPPADRLYETTHKDLDDWEAASALMKTVQVDELLDQHLEAERLLFRLFHEMGVRVYDPTPIHFSCSCTQDRIENILRTFGAEDIANIVDENGQVRTNCEFCNQSYEFSLSDLDRLGIRPNTTKN